MTDPRAEDAEGDRSGRVLPGAVRPLSPHLQVWRWHVTMAASILHRLSGFGLVAGIVLVIGWLACLLAGPESFATCQAVYGSLIGILVWIGVSWSAFYHLASGIRHLVWDTGAGLSIGAANVGSWASIGFSVGTTSVLWFMMFRDGVVG